jgi:hypothetical protein
MKWLILLLLLSGPIYTAEYYPRDWIKQDLELAKFFVYFGEPEEKVATLQDILEIASLTGNLDHILWVIERQRETNVPLPSVDIAKAWKRLVQAGLDYTLSHMLSLSHLFYMTPGFKKHLLDLSLQAGHADTVETLQKFGFVLSQNQQCDLDELREFLSKDWNVLPPAPINDMHHESHGGRDNQPIYREEFQKAVAFVLFRMQKKPCDFKNLIENLGHRRRQMAIRGKLKPLDMYGIPALSATFTPFEPIYALYGQKIQEKYPLLPFNISAFLNGRKIYLTQVNEDCWVHPDGECREEILEKVAADCQKVHNGSYPPEKTRELAYDLGKIIWWLSHSPPFLRGTPTVIAALIDAFWIYHRRFPRFKTHDLNCEALTYDQEEEFAQYMHEKTDLP